MLLLSLTCSHIFFSQFAIHYLPLEGGKETLASENLARKLWLSKEMLEKY